MNFATITIEHVFIAITALIAIGTLLNQMRMGKRTSEIVGSGMVISGMSQLIDKLEAYITTLRARLMENDLRIDTLTRELRELSGLRDESAQIKAAVERWKLENERLKREIEALQAENAELRREIVELRAELKYVQDRMEALQSS